MAAIVASAIPCITCKKLAPGFTRGLMGMQGNKMEFSGSCRGRLLPDCSRLASKEEILPEEVATSVIASQSADCP
jgi:hypothetical protein